MGVLSDAQRRDAAAIVAKYPNRRSAVLPLLFLVQSVEGYVTDEGMREIADILGLTPAQVLASASFYTMFKKKPQGTYLISVCRNITCSHLGAQKVIRALEERLGVDVGGMTPDGKFSLESAECLATCDGAPSMQVNYEDFYKLSPEEAVELVDKLERGEEVRSVRDQVVKTSKEIAHETATTGVRRLATEMESMRTIGGESPREDTKPGFRPPLHGDDD
ncbi:MAG: NADH-quinone oxidoreductase subunit NuoE [Actinomycetota bacterium]